MSETVSPVCAENVQGRAQGTKVKDPRWLRVDICRDFTAGKCKRSEFQCRFAHPKKDCVSENSKVIVCYDSMKGKCCRESCKFYHPPFHIKEHLLAFGKYLQQQRLERDRAIESESLSSGVESNKTVSVATASDAASGGSDEKEYRKYANNQKTGNDSTPRRHSDQTLQYTYHSLPVYMCQENMGGVYYSAVPSASIPTWSSPQQFYYQPVQQPALGSTAFICQGYPTMTMPVLEQAPCTNQPFYPGQYGRGNLVSTDLQYYPISPQVVMVASPQTELANPVWQHGQRRVFMTPEYSSEVNRPNSI